MQTNRKYKLTAEAEEKEVPCENNSKKIRDVLVSIWFTHPYDFQKGFRKSLC